MMNCQDTDQGHAYIIYHMIRGMLITCIMTIAVATVIRGIGGGGVDICL